MLSLSPAKILVVLVVALLVLGPDKLPVVARQLGSLWGDLRRLRARLEDEVRGVFPDLPPTHELTEAVRSPLNLLNRLADEHERSLGGDPAGPPPDDPGGTRAPPENEASGARSNQNGIANGNGSAVRGGSARSAGDAAASWPAAPITPEPMPSVPDDPSMN